eukprot:EG_transcript_14266
MKARGTTSGQTLHDKLVGHFGTARNHAAGRKLPGFSERATEGSPPRGRWSGRTPSPPGSVAGTHIIIARRRGGGWDRSGGYTASRWRTVFEIRSKPMDMLVKPD